MSNAQHGQRERIPRNIIMSQSNRRDEYSQHLRRRDRIHHDSMLDCIITMCARDDTMSYQLKACVCRAFDYRFDDEDF